MKCQNCGKEIKKLDKYCGDCGSKVQNKYFKIIKENKIKIIICSCIIVVAGITYYIFTYINSAYYKALKYFKLVSNNNIEEVYNVLDLEDTTLMNLELLKSKLDKYENVTDIECVKSDISGNIAYITFKYIENNKEKIGVVYLTKENNCWKVNSGLIANNITISIPKDSTITLDDIDITEYLDKNKSTDTLDIYTIDYMVKGEYKVKITLKDGTKINTELDISDKGTYALGNVDLTDEVDSKLNETTKNLVSSVYNGLINNNDSIEYNNDIVEYYKDLNYDYKTSNFVLNSFNITDLKEMSTTYSNGYLKVKYQIEYNYQITYSDNTYSSVNRDTITVYYDYDYNLVKIGNIDLSFPIRK